MKGFDAMRSVRLTRLRTSTRPTADEAADEDARWADISTHSRNNRAAAAVGAGLGSDGAAFDPDRGRPMSF
ncbi:hypothetical protein EVAR_103326_1 [Eumeta japonica]|uniref:Uncharacterized protein n=1 Tax=Eumeta variegata TaxID=151549 RepID=A0A4C1ZA04_EUMVA|nr:hypothetical protein EVAR_103326_1 [Eumeta japonica]